MKPVERQEIVDYATYEDERSEFRARVIEAKTPRARAKFFRGQPMSRSCPSPQLARMRLRGSPGRPCTPSRLACAGIRRIVAF